MKAFDKVLVGAEPNATIDDYQPTEDQMQCPEETPFYVADKGCIGCEEGELFNLETEACESCEEGETYVKATKKCQKPNAINPAFLDNVISTEEIPEATESDVTCPEDTPFFDGSICIACSEENPLFDYQSKHCTSCPEG